jgi:hypothetical protein
VQEPAAAALGLPPARDAIHAHRFEFGEIEAEVLRDERAQGFAVRQLGGFGGAVADDVDALVHDVDAAVLGGGAGEDVVGEERGRVGGDVMVHHLEIDGVFLFHGGDPALDLFAIAGDIEEPIVAFVSKAVGGGARRDGGAVDGDGKGAGEGAEAGVDDVAGTLECDGEEHVLARAFVARFEKEDAGGVPGGGEADGVEGGVHEAGVVEAVAASAGGDDLGLQALGVEAAR